MKIAICKYFWALRMLMYKVRFGRIGKRCYMGKPVCLDGTKGIYIGNRVRIYPGCRMETHDEGTIEVHDDVAIGQNFHITSGGKSRLVIGAHTTISGNVFVTNIDHEYQSIGVHIMQQPFSVKETYIGENCFIGYGAAIQAGTKLGKQCIVGTNSVVRGEFPDYSVIVGAPGRVVKKYNQESGVWERVNNNGT